LSTEILFLLSMLSSWYLYC